LEGYNRWRAHNDKVGRIVAPILVAVSLLLVFAGARSLNRRKVARM
jgi:hypothetical protein